MLRLREELDVEAQRGPFISFSRFEAISRWCGISTDDAGAAQVLGQLQRAGAVLRQGDTVYLNAAHVADLVLLTLPGTEVDTRAKLERVDKELAELDRVHALLERRSWRLANALLVGGFAVLVLQFVGFIYLTYWELSWDVMEPFSYHITLLYTTAWFAYFMFTGHAFDLKPVQEFWQKRFRANGSEQLKFDAERHQFLSALRTRYKKHLATAGRAVI